MKMNIVKAAVVVMVIGFFNQTQATESAATTANDSDLPHYSFNVSVDSTLLNGPLSMSVAQPLGFGVSLVADNDTDVVTFIAPLPCERLTQEDLRIMLSTVPRNTDRGSRVFFSENLQMERGLQVVDFTLGFNKSTGDERRCMVRYTNKKPAKIVFHVTTKGGAGHAHVSRSLPFEAGKTYVVSFNKDTWMLEARMTKPLPPVPVRKYS